MRAVYEEAQEARTVAEKQEILKEYGLRDVKVSQDTRPHNFLLIEHRNPTAECFLDAQEYRRLCSYIMGSIACLSWWLILRSSVGSFQGNHQGFGETIL